MARAEFRAGRSSATIVSRGARGVPLVHPSARAIPDLALRGCQAADGLAGFSEAQPALVAKNSGRARTSRWPFFTRRYGPSNDSPARCSARKIARVSGVYRRGEAGVDLLEGAGKSWYLLGMRGVPRPFAWYNWRPSSARRIDSCPDK